MYWTKLFIPTLRDEPAEAQSAAHRLLLRAGYMRGRDRLYLGQRTMDRIAAIVREELNAIGGQEVSIAGSMRSIASELRSYRQLPQIWFQACGARMRAASFDLSGDTFARVAAAAKKILGRCGVVEAAAEAESFSDPEGDLSPEEFHTPDQKSIADISRFTGLPPTAQMKSLVVVAGGELILALVRGDHQLEEEKLAWYLDARELRTAGAEEIRDAFGADAGSLGPVGARVRVIADEALRGRRNMICGANRNDYHLRHVSPGEDFQPEFHEIRERSGSELLRRRLIRSPLQVANEAAELVTPQEGAWEIFPDRLLEAAVEQHCDQDGLALPPAIAPFGAIITPVNIVDEAQRRAAVELHDSASFDVLLDDRDERAGVKFKDADLIGIPYRITLGKKLTQGMVEMRDRVARVSQDVPLAEVLALVAEKLSLRNNRNEHQLE
jgi:prolyl-tRNA synthetase